MRKAYRTASEGVEVSVLPIGKKAMDTYRRSGKLDESLPTTSLDCTRASTSTRWLPRRNSS
jgi:hypothetical protein